ncbi:MAG: type IV pilus twitching motility protein PilT [Candidatus Paceibacterota bacterium]
MSYEKFLDFVETVIKEEGSDLHIAEERKPIIRVDGNLTPINRYDELAKEDMEEILKELIPEDAKERFKENKEVDFSYSPKEGVRFRVNAYIQQSKLCAALRLIPNRIRTLEELRLPSVLYDFAQMKQGFFLVAGPTGHGKSTTLASVIDIINRERSEHIITIEDPIEYVFTPEKSIIDQREVRMDATDFPSALTAVFRQDGDVLMIGEMREPETMSTAVTAAETGHLVFSTLHTNSAAQTIERIIDSFASQQQDQIRVQLAGSLAGVFSQRLIPRIAGGIVPAYELLISNTAVSNLIREKRTHEIDTVIETSSSEGMITMNKSLADLVRDGEITMENAFLNSNNRRALERML